MKNRALTHCAAVLLIIALCFQLCPQARAASVIPTDTATAENVLEVLREYDPEACRIMETEYQRGQDIMAWFFGGLIITQIDTAVHETFHDYTSDQAGGLYVETIDLGDGACYDVDYSIAYEGGFTRTEAMSRQLPGALRTYRYNEYIAPGSPLAANTRSVFGMLNEFAAYYWGLRTMNAMARFLTDTGCGIDGWRAYVSSVGNDLTAYAEFKFWTLRYMLYLRSADPELYEAILANENYCAAYRAAETRFAGEIARSKEIAAGSAGALEGVGLVIDWTEDAIYLRSGGYGSGFRLDEYSALIAELERAEYAEMDAILKSGGTLAPQPVEESGGADLMVNGAPSHCAHRAIGGEDYYRLRDIACLLQGTAARFSVIWDGESGTVSVISGQAYVPDGSELAAEDPSGSAVESGQTFLVNGVTVPGLAVYLIGGSSFVRLRDLAGLLGFEVDVIPGSNVPTIYA